LGTFVFDRRKRIQRGRKKMSSEQNEETSYQPSDPKLCVNNCGFFGNAATMNLCSKCHRDGCMKEEQAASAKVAMEKSFNPTTPTKPEINDQPAGVFTAGVGPSSSSASANLGDDREPQQPKAANRCRSCNKKVGLTGFMCKCGMTFCGMHRYPEKHDCTFDFKAIGRDAIAKANPVVKADKVERF